MTDPKRLAAEKAVEYIEDGMTVGLGTGSTAYWAIQKIGERIKSGLSIKAVATSLATEKMAQGLNIPIASFSEIEQIDIAIDGADEVDAKNNLIKGGGGALLREKIIAYNSNRFIVVVDESKLVQQLGKFPLPVEVLPFGAALTKRKIESLGAHVQFREKDGQLFTTDNGNMILDCDFLPITDPQSLNMQLHNIPGLIETGLFLNHKIAQVIVGKKDGSIQVIQNKG